MKVVSLIIVLFFVCSVFAQNNPTPSNPISNEAFLSEQISSLQIDSIQKPTPKKIALVYKGPGSCSEDCSEGAAEVARLAGLTPQYVGPTDDNPELFYEAAIWIQPGGKSSVVGKNMTPKLKDLIRKFVSEGGAYVGFCAGGFYATDLIGQTGNIGLGLIHAESTLYREVNNYAEILSLNWNGKQREVYWEGGPYFTLPKTNSLIQVLAQYPDGTAATIESRYGLGNVVVTGAHPEAPAWWSVSEKINDTDGVDHDLAVDMVQRALKSSPKN
jgi:hypothetical protein